MRILVPTDGSKRSLAALHYVVGELRPALSALEVHLLNVQPPLPSAVTSFVNAGVVQGYHQEEGEKAIAEGRALLQASSVLHECHVAVGDPARTILDYAQGTSCRQIVMTTRGLGPVGDLLLGSVTRKVLSGARVPVTLVPALPAAERTAPA